MLTKVICHLSDFRAEYPGSFIDALICAAQYSRKHFGLETLCIFPERARGRRWLSQLDTHRVGYAFVPFDTNRLSKLKSTLTGLEPVIFHCHFVSFDLNAIALKLLYFRRAKIIWHFHSVCDRTGKQRLKDLIKVNCLGNNVVDRFVAVSENVALNAVQRGVRRPKLTTNYNGIDTLRFVPDKGEREKVRSSLGISDECTVFLNLGYDPIIKGVDVFVKAADQYINQGNRPALFIVIGRSETKGFVSRMEESRRLASALRVLDPIDNFASFLNGIDVLVSSSRSEGFSYAWLESMISKKLVLSSDLPSIKETCGDAAGVFVFPTENSAVLASLMREVCDMPGGERERLGSLNSQFVFDHFSLKIWSERLGETYRSVLGASIPLVASTSING